MQPGCAGDGSDAAAVTAPVGKITAAAVWQPPQDFLTKAHAVCDKSMSAVSFPECFMNQIAVAGAPAEAVAFTRMLYGQSDGQVGIMSAFKSFGPVDAAQVLYPLRANDNYGLLLVNGDPKVLDVDDLKKLDQAAMQQDRFSGGEDEVSRRVDIWPGDRSGSTPGRACKPIPDGGIEFIVTYPLHQWLSRLRARSAGALWMGLRCQRKVPAAPFTFRRRLHRRFCRNHVRPTPPAAPRRNNESDVQPESQAGLNAPPRTLEEHPHSRARRSFC